MTSDMGIRAWAARWAAALLLLASVVMPSWAQDAALPAGVSKVQTVEGITEYRLRNGMKVLLAPDLADDRVTVNLTYMVGSRHEGAGEGGMAHLLEHLIFKGTPKTPDPKAEFRKRGFTFNGTTSADRTNYFATFVSSQESLDWYLSWQADAMANSFIAKKDLDSEMTVVRNEFEIAGNNAFQILGQRLAAAAYNWHNYGKSTIGNRADIEQVDIAKLQSFYKRFYRPDNAVLIVAGKFDVAQTLLGIHQTLAALTQPKEPVPQTYTVEPVQDGERSVTVRRPATAQVIMAGYHVPGALHPDSVPLSVLATALGDVPSGRLHKALVEAKLAQGVFAAAGAQREAGLTLFGTVFGPDDDAAARQKILLGIVENLANEPITTEEFERAKNKLNKSLELGFANAAAVANGAIAQEVMGDWRAVFVGRERMKSVTLDDVNRVARSYLLTSNRTYGHLVPTKAPARPPEAKMPDVAAYLQPYTLNEKGLESVAFDYSPAHLHQAVQFVPTAAGLQTASLEKPVRGDLVRLNIAFKHGNLDALRNLDAPAGMVGAMLLRGTSRMTRQQIQDELVKLGAALNLNFSETGGHLSLTAKKDNFKAALDLALHLLKESNFPEKEFEEIRAAQLKAIDGQIKDKSAQASNAWRRYGNPYPKGDTRYAHTLEEWQRELQTVTRDQAYDFYKRFLGAQHAQISLLGPIDSKACRQQIADSLDGWKSPTGWTRVPQPLIERTPARLVFDTPDKTNASLQAYHGVAISAIGMDETYFGMELATRIFGSGPGSRLWQRLREGAGLSYSVGAQFSARSYEPAARLGLGAEVAPHNLSAAEKAIQEELQRSLAEGFTVTEVDTFKKQYVADRQRGRSGDRWAMGFMSGQMEFAYAKEAREKNDALIASFTADQINAIWRKYVRPEQLVWGVFGDQSKFK